MGKKPKSSHTDEEVIVIDSPENSASHASTDVIEPLPSSRSRRGRLQRQKQNKEPKPAKVTSPVRNQSVSPGAVGTEGDKLVISVKCEPSLRHSLDRLFEEKECLIHVWFCRCSKGGCALDREISATAFL